MNGLTKKDSALPHVLAHTHPVQKYRLFLHNGKLRAADQGADTGRKAILRGTPRPPNHPPPQPKYPPGHTGDGRQGGNQWPKPTSTSSRPTPFQQSCYDEDERWATGGFSVTPPWDVPFSSTNSSGAGARAATGQAGPVRHPHNQKRTTFGGGHAASAAVRITSFKGGALDARP